jgi:two-component system phosphate regulon response regulator PhoB
MDLEVEIKERRMSRPFILVVEDNREMQALVVEILQLAGMDARGIGRGDDALALMMREMPALVLLDVDLPGTVSGLDVLTAVRADAVLARTKVILLTAKHVATRTPEAEAADLVMLKPVDAEQLIILVERLIGKAA